MFTIPTGSLEAIERWAKRNFPDDFAKVASFTDIRVEKVTFNGTYGPDGEVEARPIVLTAIECGEAYDGQVVYAYIGEDNLVKLCCKVNVFLTTGEDIKDPYHQYITPISGLKYVNKVYEPFFRTVNIGAEGCVDRLETLFRYFFLRGGEKKAVRSRVDFFETHFPAACREVAQGTTDNVRHKGMNVDGTILGKVSHCSALRDRSVNVRVNRRRSPRSDARHRYR